MAVNLDTLEPQQLAQVKKQLDEELEHLTNSYAQLHGAQNKFKDCLRCVESRTKAADGMLFKRYALMSRRGLAQAAEWGWLLIAELCQNSFLKLGACSSYELVVCKGRNFK